MVRKIVVTIGDVGSSQFIAPVLSQLREKYEVTILAEKGGGGETDLSSANIPHQSWSVDDTVFLEGVSLVLCGTGGKAQKLWIAASKAAKEANVPLVWFGDFFGSGCEKQLMPYSPDRLTVIDESTGEQFLLSRPSFKPYWIKGVGNPAFDWLAEIDVDKYYRREMREKAGLGNAVPIVHYSASSMSQFDLAETLAIICDWVKDHSFTLAVSFHPADLKKQADDIKMLTDFARGILGEPLVQMESLTTLERICASDYALTDYSTTGIQSMILGIPTAFIMLESAQAYQRTRGLEHPYFPILQPRVRGIPPALGIFSQDEKAELDNMLNPMFLSSMKQAREVFFPELIDGMAGLRFLNVIRARLQ